LLSFPLRFQDRQLHMELTRGEDRYAIEESDPLTVTIRAARRGRARAARTVPGRQVAAPVAMCA
jgi:hypothetical protein